MHRIGSFTSAAILAGSVLFSPPAHSQQPITVTNDPAWPVSPVAPDPARVRSQAHSARLANVSIRAAAGAGESALIAGAVVRGSGTLPLLVRAVGPGLARFGVTNYLRVPELEVYREAALTARTNTAPAGTVAASAYVGAFPLLDAVGATAGDAALLGEPAAGTITAHCTSPAGTGGVALLEFYDASAAATESTPRVVNFSSRARVQSGEGLVVIGFVVVGQGELNLLLRAAGPTLQQFNVAGLLADPVIELYRGSTFIASNDNWRTGENAAPIEAAAGAVGAFALTSPNDSALLVTLPAGSYTLQVRDSRGGTGSVLAEIYELAATSNASFNAAQATNAVGLEVYRQLAGRDSRSNLVISPYSIESALTLAYAGADGDTRLEMARVLRLPDDTTALQSGFDSLRLALEQVAEDSKRFATSRTAAGRPTDPIQWNVANRLFGQEGYAFRDSFLTLMREGFAAPLTRLDFRGHTEASRVFINDWVEEQTRDKIKDLLPTGALSAYTRLVLVNALYLNAPWDDPFLASSTTPRPFRPTPTTTRDVPTMQKTADVGYAVEAGTTIVTLDYLTGGLQFVIILPAEETSVDAVAARLTSADFARWARLKETNRRSIALFLPKFRVEGATVALTEAFKAMGMQSAFDVPPGSANFDRIAPRRPDEYLAISDIFHQTFIALDEQGTEAAAATAVVMGVTSLPPPLPEVRVDRPFLFAIQHRATGACLFLGRIADPR